MHAQIKNKFQSIYGFAPDCTVTANGRANIIGEHTDYHYGFVFPFAIDKGIVLCGSKSEGLKIYSVNYNSYYILDEKFSIGSWQSYIGNAIAFMEEKYGLKIKLDLVFGGNLPIGAGLSSSSALCCGFIELVCQLYNIPMTPLEKVNLASQIEHGSGVIGGKMDQYTILFGRENLALILDCRTMTHEEVAVPKDWSFLLINSGVKHNLAHTEYNDRRRDGEEALAMLRQQLTHLTSLRDLKAEELEAYKPWLSAQQYNRAYHVINENLRVIQFKNAMLNEDLESCGSLLNDSHTSLRDLYEVSCDELNTLQSLATQTSFIAGSRMMGGGFGGCTINLVKQIDHEGLTEMLLNFNKTYGYTPETYTIKPASGLKIYE